MSDPKTKKQEEPLVHSTNLDPVQLQTQGSRTWNWRQDYYEGKPYNEFASKERPFIPLKYKTDEQLRRRYEKAAINSIAKKLVETRGKTDRKNWMESLSFHEKEILANSKFSRLTKPTDWESAGGASRKIVGAYADLYNPTSVSIKDQLKPDYLTKEEYKDLNMLEVLSPLDIPRKALVSAPMRDEYSVGDALRGVDDGASTQEKAMTDPLNLLGIGLFSKVDKLKQGTAVAQKWGNTAVDYGRNVVRNAVLDVAQDTEKIINHDMLAVRNGIKELRAKSNSPQDLRQNIHIPFTGPTKEQKQAVESALEFNKKWYFDTEGNLNPHVSEVLENMYEMSPRDVSLPRYTQANNELVGSSWLSTYKNAKTKDMQNWFVDNPQQYLGVYSPSENTAYTKYSNGVYKIPPEEVASTATHENAHVFQHAAIDKDNPHIPLFHRMFFESSDLQNRGLLNNNSWYGELSEFNAVQMEKRRELYNKGWPIKKIAQIEKAIQRTPLEEILRHPQKRELFRHYAHPSKDARHGLGEFPRGDNYEEVMRKVQELMKYSPAAAPFMYSEKSKKIHQSDKP